MASFELTKSDFLSFLACDRALWLSKRDPGAIDWPIPGGFDRLLMADGYAVEAVVKRHISRRDDKSSYSFQRVFSSQDGLYARSDLVRDAEDGSIEIWEIKASTRIKGSGKDHVLDAAFQTLVAERCGIDVSRVGVIHVNADYVRDEAFSPDEFLIFADVTDEARVRLDEVAREADRALALLGEVDIDRTSCDCLLKSKGNHCAAFSYFNEQVPDRSIYNIPRLSQKKREAFVRDRRFALAEISPEEVTAIQAPIVEAARLDQPIINLDRVRSFLEGMQFPLYFYDYETFGSAVPISQGLKPHEQIPVQVSLHRMASDGSLQHSELLTDAPGQYGEIGEFLRKEVGSEGHLVAWNAPFEKSCNDRLARLLPHETDFLASLNDRTFDLMDVFKTDYVDPRFSGSTSIKKVLPVLVPELQYEVDAVHDGAGAIEAWKRLVESNDPEVRSILKAELLAYCKLDTLAMVEIFRVLQELVYHGGVET